MRTSSIVPCVLLLFTSCGSMTESGTEKGSVWVRDQNVALQVTDTTSLALTLQIGDARWFTPASALGGTWPTYRSVRWQSRDADIASVGVNGVLRGLGVGTTYVLVDVDGLRDSTRVTVSSTLQQARFAAISSGGSHTCAIDGEGVAYCWGSRWTGAIGDGHVVPFTAAVSPTRVATSLRFRQISAGNDHTCAITLSLTVYCWGDNAFGQLGSSTIHQGMPVSVAPTERFETVSSGSISTCGIRAANRAVVCWGGGLRIDQAYQAPSPETFVSVTTGGQHRCALTNLGHAYCWGLNGFGQLGTGNTSEASRPVLVLSSQTFTALSAGNDYTCGISTTGLLYCWGIGNAGVLGNGAMSSSTTPRRVLSDEQFAAIDAGTTHTCALTVTGRALCWGQEFSGALGDGPSVVSDPTALDLTFPEPRLVRSDEVFQAISASAFDHTCALSTRGDAYCWGSNRNGALGIGNLSWVNGRNMSIRFSPAAVLAPTVF